MCETNQEYERSRCIPSRACHHEHGMRQQVMRLGVVTGIVVLSIWTFRPGCTYALLTCRAQAPPSTFIGWQNDQVSQKGLEEKNEIQKSVDQPMQEKGKLSGETKKEIESQQPKEEKTQEAESGPGAETNLKEVEQKATDQVEVPSGSEVQSAE